MTSVDTTKAAPGLVGLSDRATTPLFAATLALSAFLMFSVQPLFGKMVLPVLGGSPAVWSVALVFFQAVLLLGYLYAHALVTLLPHRAGVLVHGIVQACAIVSLPVGLGEAWLNPPDEPSIAWLIALFASCVGLPFLALAGNAPLLQAWYARTGVRGAANPYSLYAASNLGSFGALLLYPLLVEPVWTVRGQSAAWSAGLTGVGILLMVCGAVASRGAAMQEGQRLARRPAIAWRTRLRWVALAFVPSGLLVAVTAHLTTDIAAMPFLWVVPLALFLLTFVVVFRDRPLVPRGVALKLQPLLVATALLFAGGTLGHSFLLVALIVALAALFVTALVAHGELYESRPGDGNLTEFYVFMSLGGVLGGVFAAIAAPLLFSTALEYPLLLLLGLAARPQFRSLSAIRWRRIDLVVGASLGVILLAGAYSARLAHETAIRSFFGINRVGEIDDGRFRLFMHGTTIHGAERIRSDDGVALTGRPRPATYYYPGGAIAATIEAARAHLGGIRRVAVIGLGVGSVACYREPGESWQFFEIDPAVVHIARDSGMFRFLPVCAPDATITLGDARLRLARVDGRYDYILVDAFSSDAIPVHLLTREAFALYAAKLAPGGMLAMNISNRFFELSDIVAQAARSNGLLVRIKKTPRDPAMIRANLDTPPTVVVLARSEADLGAIGTDASWRPLEPEAGGAAWTDDFSNLLGPMLRPELGATAAR
jgi:hypothetical protein